MANPLGNKNNLYLAAAAIIVVLAAALVLMGNPGAAPNTNAIATPSVQPSVSAACTSGEQKEFECVGSISGTQTYYECVNSAWESRSRYNYSECVKTFGPNESTVDVTPVAPTNVTATPAANASITPTATTTPAFVNLSVSEIRATTAEMYWFTNANATGTVMYGEEPGVRKWRLDAQSPAFSQYKHLLLTPGKTYYFDVEVCANSTCVKTPTLNFTTPAKDTYFVGDTTIPYPGDQVNFTAAQLNSK
ncbi:MAG: hypothetical protein WCX64_02800 [Candidatus Micrarchaeia archaeon]